MKIFQYNFHHKITRVLALDPAVRDGGFSYFCPREKTLLTGNIKTDKKVMSVSFPELFLIVNSSVNKAIETLSPYLGIETNFLLEYTFLKGEFSVGLSMYNSLLVERLVRESLVGRICFVPTRMGSFFLKKRTTTKGEHVEFVKSALPGLKERITSHEADSLMLMMAVYHGIFNKKSRFDLRDPEIEVVKLEYNQYT